MSVQKIFSCNPNYKLWLKNLLITINYKCLIIYKQNRRSFTASYNVFISKTYLLYPQNQSVQRPHSQKSYVSAYTTDSAITSSCSLFELKIGNNLSKILFFLSLA